MKELKLLERIL